MSYFDKVSPTYIENWPRELCSLSIAQVDIPLSLQEARDLGTNIAEYSETFFPKPPGYDDLVQRHNDQMASKVHLSIRKTNDSVGAAGAYAMDILKAKAEEVLPPIPQRVGQIADISELRQRVAAAVEKFPKGAFIRLGSRSPKDAFTREETQRTLPGQDPLRFMLATSERICDDLHLALEENYAPHIFVRQWLDMPQWSEFRCFMQNRKLVGISQYYYMDQFEEIGKEAKGILFAITEFFKLFRDASHLGDVVFDVFVKLIQSENTWVWEVRLLEINPFFEMTDPCLFDWRRPFGGVFKYGGKKWLVTLPLEGSLAERRHTTLNSEEQP